MSPHDTEKSLSRRAISGNLQLARGGGEMYRHAMRSTFLLLGVALVAWSCGDTPVVPLKAGPAAALIVQAGQDQTGVVGRELAQVLQVKVTDASGRAVAGQIVNFKVIAGGGSVFAGAAITNDSGSAKERWTLGTVATDSQRVEARAVDPTTGAALVFGTVRAVALPDVAAGLAIATAADGARSGLAFTQQPVVRIVDRYGNLVTSATDVVTASTSAGTLGGTTAATAVGGIATFKGLALTGVTGSATLTYAASLGGSSRTVTQSLPVSGGVAASIAATTALSQSGTVGLAAAVAPAVRVLDVNGQPVGGANVSFVVATGGGAVTGGTQQTDASGIARVGTWTLGTKPGANTLRASVAGVTGDVVFTDSAQSASAVRVDIGVNVVQIVGAQWLCTVRAYDRFDNLASGTISTTLALVAGTGTAGAQFTGPKSLTYDSGTMGLGTYYPMSIDKAGGGYQFLLSSPGLPSYTTNPVALVPSGSRAVFLDVIPTLGAGRPVTIRAALQDANGAFLPYSGVPLGISIVAGTGPVGVVASGGGATTQSGVATFTLSIPTPGDGYKLSVGQANLVSGTSNAFLVQP